MTITVYKLTTEDNKTRKGHDNECTWGPGVTHSGTGKGGLCGPGYIHAYLSPELAMLLNPIHANIQNPKLWKCSVSAIALSDNGLKVGSVSLTTVEEISPPVITNRHRVIFALLCAEKAQEIVELYFKGNKPRHWQMVYKEKIVIFNEWKAQYLAGDKQTADAARAAAYAADAAARAADAARAAARAADAARAARAAAYAATDAAYAADAATDAARAAAYAARAAYAATDAAYAAAYAARAANSAPALNLIEIANRALTYS